ncbi:MAG: hypothetical protein HYZ53_08190 [Planctomycetes bacterium]|nr:hypothetical protein [Planctomycetota bacterium]
MPETTAEASTPGRPSVRVLINICIVLGVLSICCVSPFLWDKPLPFVSPNATVVLAVRDAGPGGDAWVSRRLRAVQVQYNSYYVRDSGGATVRASLNLADDMGLYRVNLASGEVRVLGLSIWSGDPWDLLVAGARLVLVQRNARQGEVAYDFVAVDAEKPQPRFLLAARWGEDAQDPRSGDPAERSFPPYPLYALSSAGDFLIVLDRDKDAASAPATRVRRVDIDSGVEKSAPPWPHPLQVTAGLAGWKSPRELVLAGPTENSRQTSEELRAPAACWLLDCETLSLTPLAATPSGLTPLPGPPAQASLSATWNGGALRPDPIHTVRTGTGAREADARYFQLPEESWQTAYSLVPGGEEGRLRAERK